MQKNAKTEKMKTVSLSISRTFISYSTLGYVLLCPSSELSLFRLQSSN